MAADRYIKDATDDLFNLSPAQQAFQRTQAFVGLELVLDTHRLLLMNLMLHGIEGTGVALGDTLSPDGERLPKADLILTNPPFGTKKGGGRPTRSATSPSPPTLQTSSWPSSSMSSAALKPGGRAAVVVPDNVLFEDNTGQRLRSWLMELCNLHTILRLPTGIFYAQGVKTNLLFFQRGKTDKANTKAVWVYDMRADAPAFGKTRPLTVEDFADFEKAYGNDPNGGAKRKDQGEEGRWRCFTREAIKARNDNLDISWLRDTEVDSRGTTNGAGGHRRCDHRPSQGGAGGYRNAVRRIGAGYVLMKLSARRRRNERVAERLGLKRSYMMRTVNRSIRPTLTDRLGFLSYPMPRP